MSDNNPNDVTLSPFESDLAANFVAAKFCLPLTVAAIIAASAGMGEHAK